MTAYDPSWHRFSFPTQPDALSAASDNPCGHQLNLHVDPDASVVTCTYTTRHHGYRLLKGPFTAACLSTILDEAMVWAATWAGKRFCVCGELTVRFKKPVGVGQVISVRAAITSKRSRLIETEGNRSRCRRRSACDGERREICTDHSRQKSRLRKDSGRRIRQTDVMSARMASAGGNKILPEQLQVSVTGFQPMPITPLRASAIFFACRPRYSRRTLPRLELVR